MAIGHPLQSLKNLAGAFSLRAQQLRPGRGGEAIAHVLVGERGPH